MSVQQPPSDPKTPIPDLKLGRGFLLGLPIFAVLALGAVVVYLLAGGLGWQGNARVVLALCGGPVIGFMAVGLFFYVVRPKVL